MTITSTFKRVTAGLLALALVAGTMPANVGGGGLLCGTAIVASAENVISISMENGQLKIGNSTWEKNFDGSVYRYDLDTNNSSYILETDIITDERRGVWRNVSIDLNGHKITHSCSAGDAIDVFGNLTITDSVGGGEIINNNFGSCIYVTSGGTLNLTGGTVKNNGDPDYANKYHVTIDRREGINVAGTLNMSGGTITENTKAIRLDDGAGTVNMSGGSISGNTYGLWFENTNATVNFSGTPVISNNDYNVFLKTGRKVNVSSALTNGANICVDMESSSGGTFTSGGNAATYKDYFHSDKNGFVVQTDGNELKLAVHNHGNFSYTSSGASITATCNAESCSQPAYTKTLTIVKPELTTYGGAENANATLNGLADFNTATGNTILETDIKYIGRGTTTYEESSSAPTSAGDYTAKITVGTATAEVDYTIAHKFTKVNAKSATCTTSGNSEYWTDELGNMYSDENGATQITEIPTIEATGHHYDESSPVWSWVKNGDTYDVTVQFKCKDCGDIIVPEAQPTKEEVIENGNKKITATVEFEDNTYTAVKSFAAYYNVTINGSASLYKYGEQVKATAPAETVGQYFAGWYDETTGVKVSDSTTYYFYAYCNTNIYAKYEDSQPAVSTEPVLTMTVTEREDAGSGKQKVSFIYDWELPTGYKLEKAAIVRSYTEEDPTISTVNTNVHYTKLTTARGTYKFNLTMGATSSAKTIHVCGYIKYKDKSGVSHEKYTDVFTSAPV